MDGSAYSDRAVLVTGAQGFIGSWLAERLLAEGARVLVPDRPAAADSRFAQERLAERCDLIGVDLLDLPSVMRALHEHDVQVVFHLAAQTVVGEASRTPLSTFEINVRGAYNLLEASRIGPADVRVVIASSSHAYGAQGDISYSEEAELRPTRPYDASKACIDMIARCYAVTFNMPVAVTRLANVFGGGDRNWSRIVPETARSLARGEPPVIASDGSPERDWLYVEDAAEAYLSVGRSLDEPALWGRAWNAGQGQLVSVLDLVQRLIAASGKQLEPEVLGEAPGRGVADRRQLDSTAIREQLGWSPAWSLDEGLEKTYRWYERDGLTAR
jgi:CDP-glucose 4,6-dehydratase